jgi:hypothetical protein
LLAIIQKIPLAYSYSTLPKEGNYAEGNYAGWIPLQGGVARSGGVVHPVFFCLNHDLQDFYDLQDKTIRADTQVCPYIASIFRTRRGVWHTPNNYNKKMKN